MSLAERWLALVGVGEDGVDGLSVAARRLVESAEFVFGGERHLSLCAGLGAGERIPWPSPLTKALPLILERRGRAVCVLATGDPFFYGVGRLLSAHVSMEEIVCLPAPSAFSLAAARLGWPLQECALLSLHARALERIAPHLQPGAKIFALSWDADTPARLAAFLTARGMGRSRLWVLEAMGGGRERVRSRLAADFFLEDVQPLNTLAIEVVAEQDAIVLPLACGLPDALFEHDGQITKREIRAMTLSALAPRRGELLWDVGAGSGSVAIEWMLRDPANRAYAIEARADRAARIERNALALGAPDLAVVQGLAPAALEPLPDPNAVFVGGAASDTALIDAIWERLPIGGRLVINAVTLEGQAELSRRFARYGGDLVSLQIGRAETLGAYHAWRPALPVLQWSTSKRG